MIHTAFLNIDGNNFDDVDIFQIHISIRSKHVKTIYLKMPDVQVLEIDKNA